MAKHLATLSALGGYTLLAIKEFAEPLMDTPDALTIAVVGVISTYLVYHFSR